MNKYMFRPEHKNAQVILKADGIEMLITESNLDDVLAEKMIQNNYGHLLQVNADFKQELEEKKSFNQVSENVISLTSDPLQNAEESSKQNQEGRNFGVYDTKRKRGRKSKEQNS